MRVATLLVLASCASGGDATPPLPEDAARLRVMTYNMNFGVAGDRSGVDAITGAAPDIVVLQETNAEWEAVLRGKFPHERFQGPKTAWPAGGLGVMSKWPIKSVDELLSDGGPFFAWNIVIDAPG
ncbi:MAG: hypothetical protein H0T65_03555, partial [Deltaproteobacteria bacterium]|nr:hypothetical protein [Deltaproteobacteria bacterium]